MEEENMKLSKSLIEWCDKVLNNLLDSLGFISDIIRLFLIPLFLISILIVKILEEVKFKK
ncbi:MAG: hypothetical protein QXI58_04780 [Candidatus Micrarchaeia archaeon]